MKVALNGLIIDEKRAGIGQYGYNLIKHLINYKDINYTLFLQDNVELDYRNIYRCAKYKESYKRILAEQLFLPFKYKGHNLIHFVDYSTPIVNIGIPYILTIHDLTFYKYPETFSYGSRKLKQFLLPISLKRAARVIVDSENTKTDVVEYFPYVRDRVRVVYPGAPMFTRVNNQNIIEKIKSKYGIEGKYILGVGTLEPRKNLSRLIDAFVTISRDYSKLNLVLIGKKGWLYNDIFNKIRNTKIEGKIVYTDYVKQEDMAALYSGAEVFVYPSFYEGFGLPPLEAMLCGTPVIVSNAASLPEVVSDAGVYIDPYKTSSIVNGIRLVLYDEILKKKLIEKGYRQATMFSWNNTAKQIINIYKEVLGK